MLFHFNCLDLTVLKNKNIVCLPRGNSEPMMLAAANKGGGFIHLISISLPQDCPRHHTPSLSLTIPTRFKKKKKVINITDTLLHILVMFVANPSSFFLVTDASLFVLIYGDWEG